MNASWKLVVAAAVVCLEVGAASQSQEARSPVSVKFHEPKTDVAQVVLPVNPTPQIAIQATGQFGLGLVAEGNKMLCCGPGAIRTNFKIDNQIVYPNVPQQQPLPPGPFNKKRLGYHSTFQFNNVHITQVLEIVPSRPAKGQTTRWLDTVLISYLIENKSDQPRSVGTRVRIDTLCVDNDGALFAAPTTHPGKILNGVELKDKTLPDFVQILQRPDLKNPGFVGHFTLKMDGKRIGPNRFLCTAHGIGDNGWDVGVFQAQGDSDCVLFWDPIQIPPRSKVEMAYAYGRGIAASPENDGRVKLAFGGSFEPGKTFTITAYVEDPTPSQTLTLELPAGMERLEGKEIQPVPAPGPASGESVVLWKARVLRTGEFPIRLRSSTGVTLTRTVTITANK